MRRREFIGVQLRTISPKTDSLLLKFVAHPFVQEKAAHEYARHGFARGDDP
jgi:hypothetical protein